MAATPSILVRKSRSFKGGTHSWTNRYHFNGGTPADSAHWTTFSDNVVNAEKAVYTSITTITETLGYAAGSDVPVFSKTYSTAGTFTAAGGDIHLPLWIAALVRYSTTARTSKNHPIYLFSYVHNALLQAGTDFELLATDQKTALETWATAWISGFSDGVNTYNRAGPNGASATARVVDAFLTHRDFPS